MANSRSPAKSQSAPTLPCHVNRLFGATSWSCAFTLSEGRPGIPKVSDTVLPSRSSPEMAGSERFQSG
jgi:hypothetical protein